jgi:hypothetical protein
VKRWDLFSIKAQFSNIPIEIAKILIEDNKAEEIEE